MKWKAYSPAKFYLTQNKYVDLETKKVAYVLVCNRHPRCRSVLQFTSLSHFILKQLQLNIRKFANNKVFRTQDNFSKFSHSQQRIKHF